MLPSDSLSDTWKQISIPLDKVCFKFPLHDCLIAYFNVRLERLVSSCENRETSFLTFALSIQSFLKQTVLESTVTFNKAIFIKPTVFA